MKVNTDAVILGAMAAQHIVFSGINPDFILDIGTGSGILSLMIAQITSGEIHAVEIDPDSCSQAQENFKQSPWHTRIKAIQDCFLGYYRNSQPEKYNIIISNPPYFDPVNTGKGNNPQLPKPTRARARFWDSLPFDELLLGGKQLLKPDGKFFVILPACSINKFIHDAEHINLHINHYVEIKSRTDKPISRIVLMLGNKPEQYNRHEMTLFNVSGEKTEAYQKLTEMYYLK